MNSATSRDTLQIMMDRLAVLGNITIAPSTNADDETEDTDSDSESDEEKPHAEEEPRANNSVFFREHGVGINHSRRWRWHREAA